MEQNHLSALAGIRTLTQMATAKHANHSAFLSKVLLFIHFPMVCLCLVKIKHLNNSNLEVVGLDHTATCI